MRRPKNITLMKRQVDYLKCLINCNYNKSQASRDANIPLRTVYRWFSKDMFFLSVVHEIFGQAHEVSLYFKILDKIYRSNSKFR